MLGSINNVRDYWYENCVNAGIFVFDRHICDYVPEPVKRRTAQSLRKC